MSFPQFASFTLTNKCNLKCQMCGQWSAEGYMRTRREHLKHELALADWKRLVDELAEHKVGSVLLRGGETFLFPGILDLLRYIRSKDMFISIDTNGTRLKDIAADLLEIGNLHLTISLDGPEPVHDYVRGVKGTYAKVRAGLKRLAELEEQTGKTLSRSFNFTISRYSVSGLGDLPDAARSMGMKSVCIVPYYYVPEAIGKAYEAEMQQAFGCQAYSWRGFHQEESGVDFELFREQLARFNAGLGEISSFPYMPLTEPEYQAWFAEAATPVHSQHCLMVDKFIDIQPGGEANFCVDYPDYSFGNVRTASIEELWNSPEAERFRAYRREKPLPVCHRCGAKYMAEMPV